MASSTAGRPGAIVYVDGFNLYYGALKRRPHLRWLDLHALGERLTPDDHELLEVKYFTAKVSNLPWNPGTADRQEAYLRALRTRPKVSVHLGHVVVRRKPARLSVPGRQDRAPTVEIYSREEKGSDVNLASEMLIDHFIGESDLAIVITDDTDLARPISFLRSRGQTVRVVSPRGFRLGRLGAAEFPPGRIRPSTLADCQLPSVVVVPNGQQVRRPGTWTSQTGAQQLRGAR